MIRYRTVYQAFGTRNTGITSNGWSSHSACWITNAAAGTTFWVIFCREFLKTIIVFRLTWSLPLGLTVLRRQDGDIPHCPVLISAPEPRLLNIQLKKSED